MFLSGEERWLRGDGVRALVVLTSTWPWLLATVTSVNSHPIIRSSPAINLSHGLRANDLRHIPPICQICHPNFAIDTPHKQSMTFMKSVSMTWLVFWGNIGRCVVQFPPEAAVLAEETYWLELSVWWCLCCSSAFSQQLPSSPLSYQTNLS